jgi:hypothetical protein
MPEINHRGGNGKIKIIKHEGEEIVTDDDTSYPDGPTDEDREADKPKPGDEPDDEPKPKP